MPISIECAGCGGRLKAPDSAGGRKTKCPKCGAPILVPSPELFQQSNLEQVSLPIKPTASLDESVAAVSPATQKLDTPFKIAASAAGVGLLLLAVSPLFNWTNIASGGVIGLKEDGKVVLGITVVAMAACIAALIRKKLLMPVVLSVQAWGTIAVFWMVARIWKVGSSVDSFASNDNPFAAMFRMQISPGSGLYLGLIGGILVAGALGFLVIRRLANSGHSRFYYAAQSLSFVFGIGLALYVGPHPPSKNESSESKEAEPAETAPFSPFGDVIAWVQAEEKWRKTHSVTEAEWKKLVTNFKERKQPNVVSDRDFWNEAKDKTRLSLP